MLEGIAALSFKEEFGVRDSYARRRRFAVLRGDYRESLPPLSVVHPLETADANTILQSLRPACIFFVPKCRHASMRILGTKKILMNQNSSGL